VQEVQEQSKPDVCGAKLGSRDVRWDDEDGEESRSGF
jgi:hypothetical protein